MIVKETIAVEKNEYERLKNDQAFLECLRSQGVDNWEGYSEACKEFNELNKETNDKPE